MDKAFVLGLYETMFRIRTFEEEVMKQFMDGNIPGFIHLASGQEAVSAGACAAINRDDYIGSTHRGHANLIAKGARTDRMMAELFARETGYCKGRGGCLHITDMSVGSLGANGIVGAGIIVANGAALSSRLLKNRRVTLSFFGDGAANQGKFHEALNLAAVWALPIVFICENNLYGEATPQSKHMKIKDISVRAQAYGMPGVSVDGQDVLKVYDAVSDAAKTAREDGGPTLIEAKTYRFHGHHIGDPETYRTKEEVEEWMDKRDPVKLFKAKLLKDFKVSGAEIDSIETKILKEIEDAVAFANESSRPDPGTLMQNVYA
ncbi:MAG: thiamine pyrophosphate-dependent dehydrogenase E1 component subunit alpha [Deltaproteobacteria bacterium]|nr:thiamine pyrophosphate-dependent dehydrogenase E1 component subunit alpha [Deltaproteobacteria bacterium]